jgi:hypothetical protein
MNKEDIRKLYRDESPATADEAARTMQEVTTDPEAARAMWDVVLSLAPTDPAFAQLFRALLDSVLIDHISERMQRDDEYALVISRRIAVYMQGTMPSARRGKRTKAA